MSLFPLVQFENKRVCVALSGGADSVCLLHNFYAGAQRHHITLTAVHCEHGIRGERSRADLAFVRKLCAEWGIELFVFQKDVPAYAAEQKTGLEEAGRAFRRACFNGILERNKADIVATAHHRDDYAETVLFRLARGTSLAGMKVFSDRFARPLQNVGRAEIEVYLKEHNLPHVEDESNADTAYTRNALRHEILPALEQKIAGAKGNLVAFARLAAKDDDYLQSLAVSALPCKGVPKLSVDLPDPVFYRAVVLALKRWGIERDYTQALLDEIAALRNLQSGKRICLPQGIVAIREGNEIVFCRFENNDECILFACGTFAFGDYTFTVGEGECEEGLRFDLDAVPPDCTVRTRREGDFFTPYGGKKKTLKKYLTDKKIPARIGHALPMLAHGNEILMIFGVEISDAVKITSQTQRRGFAACRDNRIQYL